MSSISKNMRTKCVDLEIRNQNGEFKIIERIKL